MRLSLKFAAISIFVLLSGFTAFDSNAGPFDCAAAYGSCSLPNIGTPLGSGCTNFGTTCSAVPNTTCNVAGYTMSVCSITDGFSTLYPSYDYISCTCYKPGTDATRPWRDAGATGGGYVWVPNVSKCCSDPTASNYSASCGARDDRDTGHGLWCTYPTGCSANGTIRTITQASATSYDKWTAFPQTCWNNKFNAGGGVSGSSSSCNYLFRPGPTVFTPQGGTALTNVATITDPYNSSCTCSYDFVSCTPADQTAGGVCGALPSDGSTNIGQCYCSVTISLHGCVTGTAPTPPTFTFNPGSLAFGSVTVGNTSPTQSMIIQNTGTIGATNCTVNTVDTANFVLTGAAGCVNLAGGASCTVNIAGRPSSASAFSSNVSVSCDSSVTGASTSNGLTVNGVNLPTAALSFSPTSLDFKSVIITTTSPTKTMTISNAAGGQNATGCTVTLLPDAPATTSDFTISDNCSSISAGSSCTVTIAGRPQTVGNKSASVTISCSGAGGGGASSDPSGITEVGQTYPALSITSPLGSQASPNNSYDFGNINAGSSATTDITVYNSGTLTASNCTILIAGSNPTYFSYGAAGTANNTCSGPTGTVPGGSSCTFKLTASPPAGVTAPYSSNLSVSCIETTDTNYPSYTSSNGPGAGLYTMRGINVCTIPGQYDPGTGCQCPTGYEVSSTTTEGNACRPIIPSLEFYKANNSYSDGFPVCGAGRLPVSNAYNVLDIATSSLPNSIQKYSYAATSALAAYDFRFAKDGGGSAPNPVYLYNTPTRCVCAETDFAYNSATTNTSSGVTLPPNSASCTNSSGNRRFVSDDYNTIIAQTSTSGTVEYSTVPIAANGVSNGYMGDIYGSGASTCGCPNINEVAIPIDPSYSTQSGSICQPNLVLSDATTNAYKVLTTYSTNLSSHVINPAGEILTATSIKLPKISGSSVSYQNYNRRIWTCAAPMKLNLGSRQCEFVASEHACDDGSGSGVPSVVSAKLTGGSSTAAAFRNAVNKKLACCMNTFDPNNLNSRVKYDCIENSSAAYATFDALWSGQDSVTDGAQPYAVALSNSAGQMVTGFYTLRGERCSEFSEFAGTIRNATVNQAIVSNQQSLAGGSASASSIQLGTYSVSTPAGISADNQWTGWISSKGKRVPATADEMRRCPILARAAVKVTCPTTPALPAEQTSYTDTSGVKHCMAATSLEVHLRVEQIYEIAGLPKMKTVDSVLDTTQAASVSVTNIIQSKTVGICPAGTTVQSDGSCTFQ